MRRVSAANRVYNCENDERITLTFTAHNTDLRITFKFDHLDSADTVGGNSTTFTVDREIIVFRVQYHFVNQTGTGGSYEVEVSGNKGGIFPDNPRIKQSGDLPLFRRYIFMIKPQA